MSKITEIQSEIVEEFAFLENWEDKYQYIIDLGKELTDFPEEHRTDDNKVKGCQSQVWIFPEYSEGKIRFWGDSDGLIVKGIIALLLKVLSNNSPEEIMNSKLTFIEEIGLSSHLSPTRSNGLAAMVKQIKMYALALSGKA